MSEERLDAEWIYPPGQTTYKPGDPIQVMITLTLASTEPPPDATKVLPQPIPLVLQ